MNSDAAIDLQPLFWRAGANAHTIAVVEELRVTQLPFLAKFYDEVTVGFDLQGCLSRWCGRRRLRFHELGLDDRFHLGNGLRLWHRFGLRRRRFLLDDDFVDDLDYRFDDRLFDNLFHNLRYGYFDGFFDNFLRGRLGCNVDRSRFGDWVGLDLRPVSADEAGRAAFELHLVPAINAADMRQRRALGEFADDIGARIGFQPNIDAVLDPVGRHNNISESRQRD